MANHALVPAHVAVNPLIWDENDDLMARLVEECPGVRITRSSSDASPRAREHHATDEWGCLWHFPGMYLDGVVEGHPLADWDAFGGYVPPDGDRKAREIREVCGAVAEACGAVAEACGAVAEVRATTRSYGVEHGFLFLRLTYLRGFNEAMIDVATEEPRLYELRDMVTGYWLKVVDAYLDCGATRVAFPDDLGLQDRLPISPDAWRRLIRPSYAALFARVREAGAEVYLHTDGYIIDIIPDLIECGVTTLNPQDLVNGLDRLAAVAKGRVAIDLDIDRQRITVFGTPQEVDEHIRRCVQTLGSPEGGLSLIYGVYPGTPPQNMAAVARAMQRYHDMWAR